MTDREPEAISEQVRADAAAWVTRVHASEGTEGDWLALERWLAAAPAHLAAFEAAEAVWLAYDDPAVAQAFAGETSAQVVDLSTRRTARRATLGGGWGAAIAASLVAILVALGATLWMRAGPPGEPLATAIGQTRLVTLADGSRLRLNADTRLTAYVGRGVRRIVLDRGEAEFEVAKDRAHPFVVQAGDQDVTVVGTHFDVLRRRGRVTVTVASGVVRVTGDAAGAAESYRLLAGDQLRHAEGSLGAWVGRAPVDEAFAWTRGYLVFHDAALGDVAADLSCYFPTPLRVEGATARLRFSGVLMLDTEDAVVGRLQAFAPVRAVRTGDAILLEPRP